MSPAFASPLASWFGNNAAVARFRRRCLGQAPIVLPPRDDAWRSVAPGFGASLAMAASGLPFQVAAHRQYDRSADRRRLRHVVAEGKTVFLPQVHQVLPRLMRLMVALRVVFLGPFREECSFLFLVQGTGRPGMGLHHDGRVDAFWLQLDGRRTVTIGPPVPAGTPEELDDRVAAGGRRAGWWTRHLEPGTLLYIPPRTPHAVVCRERSLALSLTWKSPRRLPRRAAATRTPFERARAHAAGLSVWDVAAGQVDAIPRVSRNRLWTQVPAVAGPLERGQREFPVWTPGGGELWLPPAMQPLARRLATMPSFCRAAAGAGLPQLIEHGVVAPRDLPLRIIPEEPAGLDGWQFA